MKRWITKLVIGFLIANVAQAMSARALASEAHAEDELRPFDETVDAHMQVDDALTRAKANGTRALLVMGANWCHDSRGLATRFAKPQFQSLISSAYELEYIDVGRKNRNIDIAQKFGISEIVGTPTVLIMTADGVLLNADTAPTWRNAASRSDEETMTYFKAYAHAPIIDGEVASKR